QAGYVRVQPGAPDYAYDVTVSASGQTFTDRDFANLPDSTPPAAPTVLAITPDTGPSSGDGITSTGAVTFTGTLGETNLLVHLYDVTTATGLGDATVSGTTFQAGLTLAAGPHRLRATAEDAAQNLSAGSFFDVFVDPAAPSSSVAP